VKQLYSKDDISKQWEDKKYSLISVKTIVKTIKLGFSLMFYKKAIYQK
jgi:hypothetical protein